MLEPNCTLADVNTIHINCRIEKDLKITETGNEKGDITELKIKEINPNSLKLIYQFKDNEEPIMLKKLEGW